MKTVCILTAGIGSRISKYTSYINKSLLPIKNKASISHIIESFPKETSFVIAVGYLKDQVKNYLNNKNFNIAIDIIEDGVEILDTGGGIRNMMSNSDERNFFVFNPDTIWNSNYLNCIKNMNKFFENNKIKNILLVVNKKLSFDKKLNGDFNLKKNLLTKNSENEYIYTGCQIISKALLNGKGKKIFSITEIWNELIKKNNLFGFDCGNKFYHLTNLEIYNQLKK